MANPRPRAVEGAKLTLHTPIIDLNKADIIRHGSALGSITLTVSCYQADQGGRACVCDSCRLKPVSHRRASPTRALRASQAAILSSTGAMQRSCAKLARMCALHTRKFMEAIGNPGVTVAWCGFALGLVFGAVGNKVNFTMGAVSDVVNIGDWGRMRMWLLAIGGDRGLMRIVARAWSTSRSRFTPRRISPGCRSPSAAPHSASA
jgi:hypothetical protein